MSSTVRKLEQSEQIIVKRTRTQNPEPRTGTGTGTGTGPRLSLCFFSVSKDEHVVFCSLFDYIVTKKMTSRTKMKQKMLGLPPSKPS